MLQSLIIIMEENKGFASEIKRIIPLKIKCTIIGHIWLLVTNRASKFLLHVRHCTRLGTVFTAVSHLSLSLFKSFQSLFMQM